MLLTLPPYVRLNHDNPSDPAKRHGEDSIAPRFHDNDHRPKDCTMKVFAKIVPVLALAIPAAEFRYRVRPGRSLSPGPGAMVRTPQAQKGKYASPRKVSLVRLNPPASWQWLWRPRDWSLGSVRPLAWRPRLRRRPPRLAAPSLRPALPISKSCPTSPGFSWRMPTRQSASALADWTTSMRCSTAAPTRSEPEVAMGRPVRGNRFRSARKPGDAPMPRHQRRQHKQGGNCRGLEVPRHWPPGSVLGH